jgi:cytochrome c peroxidase
VCNGAPCTYAELIGAAFGPAFAPVAEGLFSLIWGEAVQAYEATLVPDQTPFDRFLGGDLNALTLRQVRGLVQFSGKGRCINCHLGPMLSDATVSAFDERGPLNRDGGDLGFHNIGVRPTEEDLARGDLSIFGGVPNSVSGSTFDLGAFKTPTLRNIKLTAPYFHTGGYPTLDDVVDFYSRGGDFANAEKSADIQPRNFNASERKALVDFRVEKEHAPFDHPALAIPNPAALPAVGAKGLGPCQK